jgi:hypothetical protein
MKIKLMLGRLYAGGISLDNRASMHHHHTSHAPPSRRASTYIRRHQTRDEPTELLGAASTGRAS